MHNSSAVCEYHLVKLCCVPLIDFTTAVATFPACSRLWDSGKSEWESKRAFSLDPSGLIFMVPYRRSLSLLPERLEQAPTVSLSPHSQVLPPPPSLSKQTRNYMYSVSSHYCCITHLFHPRPLLLLPRRPLRHLIQTCCQECRIFLPYSTKHRKRQKGFFFR